MTEAERRQREGPGRPVLLDVREPAEFETVRAPGAFLVPMSTFQTRIGEIPADRPADGRLPSRRAVGGGRRIPDPSGRSDVVNVAGGMDAWERAGLPVRRGAPTAGEGDLTD